jgi:hypothetical protein
MAIQIAATRDAGARIEMQAILRNTELFDREEVGIEESSVMEAPLSMR